MAKGLVRNQQPPSRRTSKNTKIRLKTPRLSMPFVRFDADILHDSVGL
jgi:hypothetical protein